VALYKYILKRLALFIPVLFGVLTMTFIIAHSIPADPFAAAIGQGASKTQIDNLRSYLGLDKPLYVQYFSYISAMFTGNWGRSIYTQIPVSEDLPSRFSATLELTLWASIIMLIIGVPAGIFSAVYKGKLVDHVARLGSILTISMPAFWLSLLFQAVFYGQLHWLPIGGRLSQGVTPPPTITGMYTVDSLLTLRFGTFLNAVDHVIGPAIVLSMSGIGIVARLVRSYMLGSLKQDFVRGARAKGLAERQVLIKYAFRGTMVESVTVVGLSIGYLMGSAFLVEYIFNWPGLGQWGATAILDSDYPIIMAVAYVFTLVYLVINLGLDILYSFLDPRIKY
jgi:ABC-type dipeptide/oligopeptide/nickel transport system permease component